MDKHTKEQRRKNMQAIRSKDTSIELTLRKALWKRGIRYRKNYPALPGKPDIALTKNKIAVFCDSEFWHGYEWEIHKADIKSNRDYWIRKIERNMERDSEINSRLNEMDWIVVRVWGKHIKKNLDECAASIQEIISRHDSFQGRLLRLPCDSPLKNT